MWPEHYVLLASNRLFLIEWFSVSETNDQRFLEKFSLNLFVKFFEIARNFISKPFEVSLPERSEDAYIVRDVFF